MQPASSPESRNRFRLRPTQEIVVRVGIAIALVVISVFTDRQFLMWGLIASLAVIFVPRGRGRSFLAGIVPYATAWFLFSFLRSFADETIIAHTVNTQTASFERWLFGGELPNVRLQARFFDPDHLHWYDYFFTFVHWSYFIMPHAVALRLWWKHRNRFRHFLLAMTMTLTLGCMIYFVMPSNPPWMAPEAMDTPTSAYVLRIMEPIGKSLGGGLYEASYKVVGESNPIAAMPSLHFGVTFLLALTSLYKGARWRFVAFTYAFLMGLALVYMGEHYVIDLIVGGSVATYSFFMTRAWLNQGNTMGSRTALGPPSEDAKLVPAESAAKPDSLNI